MLTTFHPRTKSWKIYDERVHEIISMEPEDPNTVVDLREVKSNTGKNIGFPGHLLSGMHTGNPEKDFLIWKSKWKSHVSCEECWHILMLRKLSVILKERCHILSMAFLKCRKFLKLQWTIRISIMTCRLIISKQKEWQLQHFLHKDNQKQ